MKRFLLICALLIPPISLSAAVWYDEYDAGLKAISAENWNSAETRLKSALKLQPKQGRKVLAYGVRFIRYIPDYHLGVVYFNQGKHQDALNQLQRIQKTGLVAQSDPEFPQMTRLIQLASEQLKPKTEEKKPPVVSPMPVPDKPKAEENLPLEAPKTEPLEKEVQQTSDPKAELLKQRDFEAKLAALSKAINKKDWVTAQRFAQQVSVLDSKNRELIQAQSIIDQGLAELKVQELEDRGLLAFFSADYQQAIVLFERMIADKKASAETWFYLGCSHAALGLLQGKDGQELLQKAQREFAQARKLNPKLNYAHGLISPRIVELYRQAP